MFRVTIFSEISKSILFFYKIIVEKTVEKIVEKIMNLKHEKKVFFLTLILIIIF